MKNKDNKQGEFASLFRKGFKGSDEQKENMEFNADQQERLKKEEEAKKKKKGTFSRIMGMLTGE
jgi:hypothetical protein